MITTIKHLWKSLLFDKNRPWMKNDGGRLFDVTMGSFEGVDDCELVGSYLLDIVLGSINAGLYRDDGLALT